MQAFLAGVATTDITPPVGTPSAGYVAPDRNMTTVHDPLLAIALVLDTGDKQIAFCAVDHVGFDHTMVEEIRKHVPGIHVIIGSSHTHSGAGAHLNIPVVGKLLAGPYQSSVRQMLIDQTVSAIVKASKSLQEAEIGFGYGQAADLVFFRSNWPQNVTLEQDLALIKIVGRNGQPIAALFNYAVHPTVLSAQNPCYSADFVGEVRAYIKEKTGACALFFNGAQAEINPKPPSGKTEFDRCKSLGMALGKKVTDLWDQTETTARCSVDLTEARYSFKLEPTSSGLKIPFEQYDSEFSLLVLNGSEAFVTIPGEFSVLYAQELKRAASYQHLSILGLTNDAHGYILKPEAFEHNTHESQFSFGGPTYGNWLLEQILLLLQ